jgi:hypothetical protein
MSLMIDGRKPLVHGQQRHVHAVQHSVLGARSDLGICPH